MENPPVRPLKDDFEKISGTDVTDIRPDFFALIKKRYWSLIILPIICLLVGFLGMFLTKFPHVLIFSIVLWIIVYALVWQNLLVRFLEKFASGMGYSYENTADISSVVGTLFSFGHSQRMSSVVSGKYFGQDTRLFIFSTTEGSGKSKHTYMYSVLEIFFDTMLPDILLNNRKNWLTSSQFSLAFPDNERKLSLEGDFQEYFTLHVAKEYEIEALQIFTPDVMQMFIDKAGNMSMEIYKNRVYLYYPSAVSKKNQLLAIYGLAKDIIVELGPTFTKIKDDVEHMSKYAKLT
jgi:hypothetical protein